MRTRSSGCFFNSRAISIAHFTGASGLVWQTSAPPSPVGKRNNLPSAWAKMPTDVFDYYEGGALDEITLRENTAGWERLKLYYRVLAGVGPRDMSTTILGQPVSMPIAVAPTAFHKLACEGGEIAMAKA